MSAEQSLVVVYDHECPFCRNYVALLKLRETLGGRVRLVNARESNDPAVKLVKDRGIVLDNEMAAILDGKVYAGADCINRLALLSTQSTLFNKLNALLFRHSAATKLAYPVLATGRRIVLAALGRPRLGY